MIQHNILNVTFSNQQLNKLKLRIKKDNEVTLKLSSNDVGDTNDENNFPRKPLLTYHKALANGSSANMKLSKIQLHKIGESGGFLGRLLERLLKTGLSLMKDLFKPLDESVLMPLELTAPASATDAAIPQKMFGSGTTTFILSNEEINYIMKNVNSREESGLLTKDVSKTVRKKRQNKKKDFSECYQELQVRDYQGIY